MQLDELVQVKHCGKQAWHLIPERKNPSRQSKHIDAQLQLEQFFGHVKHDG